MSPSQALGPPHLSSALSSSRFPFGADPGQRDPGSELLLQLHPDEAQSLLCPGRGQPRGQAHRAPPPHGLQCQCRCLLLLHLLLGGWPWLHPLRGQWTMGAGREGVLFSFSFFFFQWKNRENKCTLSTPQLDCVVKHTCYVHSVHLACRWPRGLGNGFSQGLKPHPQVLALQLDLKFICVPPLPVLAYSCCCCQ